ILRTITRRLILRPNEKHWSDLKTHRDEASRRRGNATRVCSLGSIRFSDGRQIMWRRFPIIAASQRGATALLHIILSSRLLKVYPDDFATARGFLEGFKTQLY